MQFYVLFTLVLSSLALSFELQTPIALTKPNTPQSVHDALQKAKIIPTVLSDFNPICLLDITYPKAHATVHYGNTLHAKNLTAAPVFEIHCPNGLGDDFDADKGDGFVIALTDPDAPSRKKPKWSEMAHWVVSFSGENGGVNKTEIVEYKPPGPPEGTGKHRYVFALMAGDITELKAPKERKHWGFGKGKGKNHRKTKGVQKWANGMGVTVVGANWFVAEYEK